MASEAECPVLHLALQAPADYNAEHVRRLAGVLCEFALLLLLPVALVVANLLAMSYHIRCSMMSFGEHCSACAPGDQSSVTGYGLQ